jgi:transposase
MNKVKEYVGIDISKDSFDVSFSNGTYAKFSNDAEGFECLLKSLSDRSHCVMEQTGRYHYCLAVFLFENGMNVSVVNALIIKRFVQMRLKITKTDKADARMIREYAQWDQPKDWKPRSEYIAQCRDLRALVGLLLKQSTALQNQLHGLGLAKKNNKLVIRVLKKQIRSLKSEVQKLEKEMEELIKEKEGELLTNLCTIPGIGKKTAMLLVISTNGFRDFDNYRQLSNYFGLSPTIRLSGSSIQGKSRINKTGNKDIRNLLFMCSFTAHIHNKACRELFERITSKGKSKKLALIAVCNKLLKQSLAIAQSGIPYDPEYRSRLK